MKKQNNYVINLNQTQWDSILECFGVMHERGGVVSAEIEYLLMIIFNKDTDKVNEILNTLEDSNDKVIARVASKVATVK